MTETEPTRPRSSPMRWWIAPALAVVVGLGIYLMIEPGPLPGEVAYVTGLQRLGEPVPSAADFVRFTTSTEAALVIFAIPIGWMLRTGDRNAWIAVGIAALTMLVAQPVVKEIVDRPRPTAEQVEVRAEHESKSYPSGHSMSTTTVWGAVAGALWATRRRGWAVTAAVPIAVTFVSSGVQGVHWPSDSVAGTLLGLVAAALIVPRLRATTW